jgi:hypothetical protein
VAVQVLQGWTCCAAGGSTIRHGDVSIREEWSRVRAGTASTDEARASEPIPRDDAGRVALIWRVGVSADLMNAAAKLDGEIRRKRERPLELCLQERELAIEHRIDVRKLYKFCAERVLKMVRSGFVTGFGPVCTPT